MGEGRNRSLRRLGAITLLALLVMPAIARADAAQSLAGFGRAMGGEPVTAAGVVPLEFPDGEGDFGADPPSDEVPSTLAAHDLEATYVWYSAAGSTDFFTRINEGGRSNVWNDGSVEAAAFEDGAIVTSFYLASPLTETGELGAATTLRRSGLTPFNDPARPDLAFTDATDAYRAQGGELSHLYWDDEAGGFRPADTDAFAIYLDEFFYIVIPWAEVGAIEAFLMHIFEGAFFDVMGEVGAPHEAINVSTLPRVDVVVGEIPPEPSAAPTTTAPTTTLAEPTTTSTAAAATSTTAAATSSTSTASEDDDFNPRTWVWVVIILTLLGLGATTFIWRTRARRKKPPPPGQGGGGEVPGPVPDDPRDLPPPTLYGEEVTTPVCDWAVYFEDGKLGSVPLRSAVGHECCVYRIRVTTEILDHVQTARFLQPSDRERVQLPWYGYRSSYLDFGAGTAVRSSRADDTAWVDDVSGGSGPIARGDVTTPDSRAPEVAAHLTHREATDIEVTLESGCPTHENEYRLGGTAYLLMSASQECSNEATGRACPVDVTAFGGFSGEISGDITAAVSDTTLPERARDSEGPGVVWSVTHEHQPLGARLRPAYESERKQDDLATVTADATSVRVYSYADAGAGLTVPREAWGSTRRVLAGIDGQLRFEVTIDGKMVASDCRTGTCGGHGACRCAPAFELLISSATAEVRVEGRAHSINRPGDAGIGPPIPGGARLWELPGPPI